MSAKMATLRILKLKIFRNKCYEALIFKFMMSPTKLYDFI